MRQTHKAARSLHAHHTIRLTSGRPLRHKQLSRLAAPAATQDSKERGSPLPQQDSKERGSPSPQQEERRQQPSLSSSASPVWVQQLQSKWQALDTPQKAYAVVVGLAALALTPKLLTLAVLGVERVIIGGLLVVEEALLELLFRGGAVVSDRVCCQDCACRGECHPVSRCEQFGVAELLCSHGWLTPATLLAAATVAAEHPVAGGGCRCCGSRIGRHLSVPCTQSHKVGRGAGWDSQQL